MAEEKEEEEKSEVPVLESNQGVQEMATEETTGEDDEATESDKDEATAPITTHHTWSHSKKTGEQPFAPEQESPKKKKSPTRKGRKHKQDG